MSEISEHLVERTWQNFAASGRADFDRAARKLAERQPALLNFVLETTDDCRNDVRQLAVYLLHVIHRMFDLHTRHRLKKISVKQMLRRYEERYASLERLEGAHDVFIERAATVEGQSQPHVFRYLIEAILEKDEGDLELTENEEGLLVFVLTTVIELLDSAAP